MTKDEALKLALEALECALSDGKPYIVKSKEAITVIKEALAQPPAGRPVREPVATISITRRGTSTTIDNHFEDCVRDWPEGEYKLVLAPPLPVQPQQDFKTATKEDAPLVKWAKEQTPPLPVQPQRTWVGLTDDERESIANATIRIHGQEWAYATAIEAKLKEKNT